MHNSEILASRRGQSKVSGYCQQSSCLRRPGISQSAHRVSVERFAAWLPSGKPRIVVKAR